MTSGSGGADVRRRYDRPMPDTLLRQRFLDYLDAYVARDLARIDPMLADGVTLRDWNLQVRGRAAALAETQRNFEGCRAIAIEVLATTASVGAAGGTVAGELRIVVDGAAGAAGPIELFVVDVIDFDARGRIAAIRAYLGRGDDTG